MGKLIHRVEQVLVVILTAVVAAIIALATIDLVWMIVQDVITPPVALLEVTELLNLLGFVLIVLVGIELMETLRDYLHARVVRLEVVLDVALIAIARKIIVLDVDESPPMTAAGIAAIVIALGVTRYLARCGKPRTALGCGPEPGPEPGADDRRG